MYGGVQIIKNPAIFSGRPVIGGHRITIHDVVVNHRAGPSIEQIAEGYSLTRSEVTAALEYYQDHKATIDRQIAADEREFDRRVTADMSPVAERMREIGRASERR